MSRHSLTRVAGRLARPAQSLLGALGYSVERKSPLDDQLGLLMHHARARGATTALDVGASAGEFGSRFIKAGWDRPILSFEPLSAAHARLTQMAGDHADWTVMPRTAVGAEHGRATINVSENSQSSSLLAATESSKARGHGIAAVASEEIEVNRLDDLLSARPAGETYLLKLDVQGFEMEVLKGATETLARTAVIFSEMALSPAYVGAPGFVELSQAITGLGFRCIAIHRGYSSVEEREMFEVDALFVRREPVLAG